jgi:CheY-like chemotaxis protein
MRVLVVEDGTEYSDVLSRFSAEGLEFARAGSGAAALAALGRGEVDVLFLDMRFDRVDVAALLGDLAATAERFNGDPVRARKFLEDNQGAYILAAVRDAGFAVPAVFSHDFDGEPRRWENLLRRYAPVSYLRDNASAGEMIEALREAGRG